MKRKALVFILIVVIVLSVVTCFFYNGINELQRQNSSLQNQINELEDQNRKLKDQNNELQNQISEIQDQNSKLQDQVIELENMINIDTARDVKIAGFEWKGGYYSLGQVNLFQAFKVTIQNMADKTVSGLTLSVELFSAGANVEIDEYHKQIDIIRAGEKLEIGGAVSVGVIGGYTHSAVGVITLSLGDVLLDQWTRNLSGSF
jgi:cell division protein FtsB